MPTEIWVAIIVAVGALLNTIANGRILKKIEEVRHATNSMKDSLVRSALLEGEQKGKEKQIAIQEKKEDKK